MSLLTDFFKIYLIHLRPKIEGNSQFHGYRYAKVHSCKACKPIQATRWIFLSNSTECIGWITASPRRNNRHELPFSSDEFCRVTKLRHSLSLFFSSSPSLSLPLSILDRVGSTDVFVRPGENSQPTTKGTLPFSRDLHKISILFDVREKYRRVTNTHARISSFLLPPSSSPSSSPWMNLRLATIFLPVEKPAPLDLTNGTTKERNRYFHGSTRFRACIPRTLRSPAAPVPPSNRPSLNRARPFAQFTSNSAFYPILLHYFLDASFFSTLFPTVRVLSLDS